MKKIFLSAIFSLSLFVTFAQAKDSATKVFYKQFPNVPALKLMRVDSSFFIAKDLVQKKKPTVIILFSPSCSHCQHQAEEITSHSQDFKDVNFIFVSSYEVSQIKEYISNYALNKFPNITVAYDKEFALGHFYNAQSLPTIFVYDKKGKLVSNFDTNVKADTLMKALVGKSLPLAK